MTVLAQVFSGTNGLFRLVAAIACILLGAIALYSAGVGLIDPKTHRAAGFALALLVGVAASRMKRANKAQGQTAEGLHLVVDLGLILATSCRPRWKRPFTMCPTAMPGRRWRG